MTEDENTAWTLGRIGGDTMGLALDAAAVFVGGGIGLGGGGLGVAGAPVSAGASVPTVSVPAIAAGAVIVTAGVSDGSGSPSERGPNISRQDAKTPRTAGHAGRCRGLLLRGFAIRRALAPPSAFQTLSDAAVRAPRLFENIVAMAGGSGGGLPAVRRVVNSNMGHAADRAVERAGFSNAREAREALRRLGQQIEDAGALPAGTVVDSARPDRVVVPGFGSGGAVVYQIRNGVLKLKTVLVWRP
jgi:hypothetical protein